METTLSLQTFIKRYWRKILILLLLSYCIYNYQDFIDGWNAGAKDADELFQRTHKK